MNWGALDFALGWIRGKGRASREQSRDGGRICWLSGLSEGEDASEYCDRVMCVCVCVCVWLEKMVLCWPPVREQERGLVVLSRFTSHCSPGWLATPPEPSLNVAENGFEKNKMYFAETRSAFPGTWSASNMEKYQVNQPLLFVYVSKSVFGNCSWPRPRLLRQPLPWRRSCLELDWIEGSYWPVATWEQEWDFWLAGSSWLCCFYQGHGVILAFSLADPGSALPLRLLSLTTGEEMQNENWQEVRGQVNSKQSIYLLSAYILHFVHSDFWQCYFS